MDHVGCVLQCPVAPDFVEGRARVAWEFALPQLWVAYYQAFRAGAARPGGVGVGENCGVVEDKVGNGGGFVFEDSGGRCDGKVVFDNDGVEARNGVSGGCDVSARGGAGENQTRVCERNSDRVEETQGVSQEWRTVVSRGLGDAVVNDQAGVISRGKWYSRNRRKRDRAKAATSWRQHGVDAVRSVGLSEQSEVEGSVTLVDTEKIAKESFARRRAAENAVAEKLAKMKLASLEDEKKCQEYVDLKRQRVIQWTNEATAKSQQSLEKCKSIDPGSSSSQAEIRQQAKELADLKLYHSSVVSCFRTEVENADAVLKSLEFPSTATMEMYEAGAGDFEIGVVDY